MRAFNPKRGWAKYLFLFFLSLGVLSPCYAEDPRFSADAEIIVFVTNSGKKYHRDGCSSLSRSKIALSLGDAARAYGPCSICRPPSPEKAALTPPLSSALYRVSVAEPPGFSAVDISRLLRAEVVDHVDGDTVRVRIANPPPELGPVETIRLIGVDTPETVHPRKEVEPLGREASDFTKTRLLGKTVYLAFDWDLRDRYNRLLAYIYTEEGLCHNAEIIRAGFGHAYTRFSFRFMEEFRVLERGARENRRGLWE
ncbi:MAG: thermonuclease family protein [Treponema sp.]|jgi:micrococcal nuclease|nr:thermonuclease family protein [Treponema sp.]